MPTSRTKASQAGIGLTRPIIAIVTIVVMVTALAIAVLWWTAGETNRVDDERTGRALVNAVAGEAAELQAVAEDNGQWDDAAAAVFGNSDLSDFMTSNYADVAEAGELYDGVLIVDSRGQPDIALRQGVITGNAPSQWVGSRLPQLLESATRNDGAASGVISGSDGVRVVAVSQVLPTSDDMLAAHRRAGQPARYIVFTRVLDQQAIAAIGEALVVRGLHLTLPGDGHAEANSDPADSEVPLHGVDGQILGTLHWHPSAPANRAIWRSLPVMGLALVIGLLVGGLLMRRSYAAIAQMNEIASLDSLSDLPNRRTLRRMVRRAFAQNEEVALAFMDLDGFKTINDLYGHGIGDALIVQCADFIKSILPRHGGAARLGGDEFALFAQGAGADTQLELLCGQLLDRMRQPFHIGDRTLSVGASIGLANRRGTDGDVSELMRRADVAMYVAKRSGKMRMQWFAPDHDSERNDARDIEQRLRLALDRDEFAMVYQPLIAAQDGETLGFEALLRWDSGLVPPIGPDRFIPIAEDTGLIDRIGQFALRRACLDAQFWPDSKLLSVNVSTAQLRNPYFPEMVKTVLVETAFPADRLMLEITETYIVNDPALARRVLTQLRELGVRVALDDFGSGFASIGFLRQFTFDTLKIDKSLVSEAMGDHAARAMLHSSVAVARAMGIQTVAEGVETEAQAVIMRAAGCDILQGWHFGREQAPGSIGESEQSGDERRRA